MTIKIGDDFIYLGNKKNQVYRVVGQCSGVEGWFLVAKSGDAEPQGLPASLLNNPECFAPLQYETVGHTDPISAAKDKCERGIAEKRLLRDWRLRFPLHSRVVVGQSVVGVVVEAVHQKEADQHQWLPVLFSNGFVGYQTKEEVRALFVCTQCKYECAECKDHLACCRCGHTDSPLVMQHHDYDGSEHRTEITAPKTHLERIHDLFFPPVTYPVFVASTVAEPKYAVGDWVQVSIALHWGRMQVMERHEGLSGWIYKAVSNDHLHSDESYPLYEELLVKA